MIYQEIKYTAECNYCHKREKMLHKEQYPNGWIVVKSQGDFGFSECWCSKGCLEKDCLESAEKQARESIALILEVSKKV